jgi:hypothetical protein
MRTVLDRSHDATGHAVDAARAGRSRGIAVALVLVPVLLASACGGDDAPTSAAPPTTVASTTTTAPRPGCSNGRWPPLVFNEPTALSTDQTEGYYVWVDYGGWHVRFLHTGADPLPISGRVVASDLIANAKAFPEGAEGVTTTANEVEYTMNAATGLTGLDVNVGCASKTVRFELGGDAGLWPIETIFLGKSGQAIANPFVVERQPTA